MVPYDFPPSVPQGHPDPSQEGFFVNRFEQNSADTRDIYRRGRIDVLATTQRISKIYAAPCWAQPPVTVAQRMAQELLF